MPSYMDLICCIITGFLGYEVYIDENGDAEGNFIFLTLEYDEDAIIYESYMLYYYRCPRL